MMCYAIGSWCFMSKIADKELKVGEKDPNLSRRQLKVILQNREPGVYQYNKT